jgi:hypothetical protein
MSKKKRRTDGCEVAELRIEESKRWAYERRLEHLSYREMARRSIEAPEDGGLGYYLGPDALKGRVTKYREDMTVALAEDRAEHVERELNDLDTVQRLALAAMRKGAAIGALDVHASNLYLKAGVERRKLLGLDAPVESKVDVTVRDAVTDELNAMLAEAGIAPIESETSDG